MPLLKNGHFADDIWQAIDDAAPLPVGAPILVSHARLLGDDGDYLFHCGCRLGVRLGPDHEAEDLVPWIGRIDLIALEFPIFSDGRAYSQARILRQRLQYKGELRATGDILVDQYAFMLRAGFNAFELNSVPDLDFWQSAASQIGILFQADVSADGVMNALRARTSKTEMSRAA